MKQVLVINSDGFPIGLLEDRGLPYDRDYFEIIVMMNVEYHHVRRCNHRNVVQRRASFEWVPVALSKPSLNTPDNLVTKAKIAKVISGQTDLHLHNGFIPLPETNLVADPQIKIVPKDWEKEFMQRRP